MSLTTRLRTIVLCAALELGVLSGVPMRPEEIRALMNQINQPKLAHVLPTEEEGGDDPPAAASSKRARVEPTRRLLRHQFYPARLDGSAGETQVFRRFLLLQGVDLRLNLRQLVRVVSELGVQLHHGGERRGWIGDHLGERRNAGSPGRLQLLIRKKVVEVGNIAACSREK